MDSWRILFGEAVPVSIGLRSELTSTGQIAELINELSGTLEVAPYDDGGVDAKSFFDVWPEIYIGDTH
jgi:hypothetical protein